VNAGAAPLVAAASAYYRGAGRFARQFARGKLAGDPVFAAILAQGLLAGRARILDLGCGQGLLAAWLMAAQHCHAGAGWPAGWPAPPPLSSYRGIEINPREAARARCAFALDTLARAQIVHGDIAHVDYGTADAVVILDVLHYIDPDAQERVLERVRAALGTSGVLLLRVGDADGGLGFALGALVDRAVVLLRRRRWRRLSNRSLADWRAVLERLGFEARVLPMSAGTVFANMLLVARAR